MTISLQPEVGGRKIGFQTGPRGVLANRPSLVLIHGAGGSRLSWRFQLPALDEKINVLALELPGHGETTGPALGLVAEQADFVAAVLKAWDLPGPTAVGGHSMGGAICLELALRHPDLAQGLILAATGARLAVNQAIFDGLKNDFSGTVKLIVKWTLSKNAAPILFEESLALLTTAGPDLLLDDFAACGRFDAAARLARVNVRTLVVGGAEDKMTPPALSRDLAETIPGARLELIEQAGHTLMAEQPGEFNRVVLEFVSKL
ncbi:MAG: alpha/beta hydrolase [Pseudomonadota bacterium]